MKKVKATPSKEEKGSPDMLERKNTLVDKAGLSSRLKKGKRAPIEKPSIEYLKYGDMIRMWVSHKETKMPFCLDSGSAERLYLNSSAAKDPQGSDLFRIIPANPNTAFGSMRADMKRISKIKGGEVNEENKEVNIDGYSSQMKEQIPKIIEEYGGTF